MDEAETLGRILERLDVIMELMLPGPRIGVEEKERLLTSARKRVYNLCDMRHTTLEIAKELNKSESNIRKVLSELRTGSLIKTMQLDGRTVFARIA